MNTPFAWTCPYCQKSTTIAKENFNSEELAFHTKTANGKRGFHFTMVTCPNPDCLQYEVAVSEHVADWYGNTFQPMGAASAQWTLRPRSKSMPLPAYVPVPIVEDYDEACLIRDLSPKASATLSRRCLQGMIRDFWGISKSRLIDEIKALEDKVDPETWGAIDAIRDLGNIGAHMEKDINIIVEVDADEAQMLIDLIELLVKEWYIARYNREQRVSGIKKLAAEKKAAKTPDPS